MNRIATRYPDVVYRRRVRTVPAPSAPKGDEVLEFSLQWNGNGQRVIHGVRNARGGSLVSVTLNGGRPTFIRRPLAALIGAAIAHVQAEGAPFGRFDAGILTTAELCFKVSGNVGREGVRAIFVARFIQTGESRGAPLKFYGPELEGLGRAVSWLLLEPEDVPRRPLHSTLFDR